MPVSCSIRDIYGWSSLIGRETVQRGGQVTVVHDREAMRGAGERTTQRSCPLRARSGEQRRRTTVNRGHVCLASELQHESSRAASGRPLADRGIKLSLGGQLYDPTDPMGKMFFNILATFAEDIELGSRLK